MTRGKCEINFFSHYAQVFLSYRTFRRIIEFLIFFLNIINIVFFCIRLTEYDACEKLFREIMEQLTLRDREPRTSQTFINLSANIRLRMRQYSGEVQQLKIKVEESSKQRNMYPFSKILIAI